MRISLCAGESLRDYAYRVTAERDEWRQSALRVGEELGGQGPYGYYDFTAEQWRIWALETIYDEVVPLEEPPR